MENLKEIIENLETTVVIDLWNRYCDENRYYEDRICTYEEFMLSLDLSDLSPLEVLEKYAEDYCNRMDYCVDTIYGLDWFTEDELFNHVYIDDLVRYIENNPDEFNDVEEIEEFFEENT